MSFLGSYLHHELQDGGGAMFIAMQSEYFSDRTPRELRLTFAIAPGVSERRWLRHMNEGRGRVLALQACLILTGKYLIYLQ